ncbi:Beta-glucosidase cel3A [Purpureocillium lavendulum]|uniref:Beta-glucosidase cel3A n=1 Tax=Purpureocillium lavendulum TaxID=1247861 RepID=A0AB34FFW3_9HYPO|nr:Beta-glucosidase cel3A [Purpureocillium lavendulum]
MIGQQNAIDRLFEQQAARQEGHDIEQEHHLLAAVDDELYNQALVNLLTAHSLPHSLVEWPEWYAMLHTVNYMAPGVVTQSRGQVPKLLEASFITHREKLRSKLKSSLTQVHFSIDIWSSPNHHSLLGIVAHFIDRECRQLRKALLALRELEGAHSGEAIAETFLTVIDSYGLHGQVGYFTLDNAYNNDTMLQAIAKACDFDTAHRRLRCNGHIINLAVQAFLFGRNKDASDEALRQVSQLSKDEQEGVADRRDTATAWRRHGALGMLHNLVVWVRSSGQRYQAFSKAAGRMIPQDNSTRWNSWYLMIHVAIKARKEVNSFIDDHYTEGDISLDYLHPEHWQELQEIHDFLQPFHEITKDTQWDNSSLDEVICSMDFLITHYKASTEKFRHSLTMTDRIMTSWYKFDDYYRRTDDSPVYAAAILLHPSLRRAHLHEAWKDQSQYIGPAVEAVRKLWEDYKPRQVPTINEDLSAYEAYKQRIYQPPSSHDEFNRFIDGPTLPIGSSSALSWWLEPTQATSFPNLYRLAVNIFSIPAMSAEAERVFSGARRTITWDRSTIKFDGRPIETLNLHWLRKYVRLVQQEPILFRGTVFDNVCHGLVGTQWENVSRDEKMPLTIEAAKTAYAHDFITELPNGYDTEIGQRGGLLSGGQKQRVAIACSVVSQPKVLLLDEATSALPHAEGIVQQALDRAADGRTAIVIAHKLATIKKADNIVVMSKGRIVEQGAHADLVAHDGVYAQLVRIQNLLVSAAKASGVESDGMRRGIQ